MCPKIISICLFILYCAHEWFTTPLVPALWMLLGGGGGLGDMQILGMILFMTHVNSHCGHTQHSAILCNYPQLAFQQMSHWKYYTYLRFSLNYETFLYKCFVILETKSTKPLQSDHLSIYAMKIIWADLCYVGVSKCVCCSCYVWRVGGWHVWRLN